MEWWIESLSCRVCRKAKVSSHDSCLRSNTVNHKSTVYTSSLLIETQLTHHLREDLDELECPIVDTSSYILDADDHVA